MGKTATKVFNCLSLIQFVVIGAAFGLSCFLLAQLPTRDNILAIIYVSFTGFSILSTLTGWIGNCGKSKCLLKCSGIMGIVCILIFAIIAILSGLWYGGINVLPDSAPGNFTLICEEFKERNVTREALNELTTLPQIQNQTDIQVSTTSQTTTVAPVANATTNATPVDTDNDTVDIESVLEEIREKFDLNFDETRLMMLYCNVEGFFRDLIFGRNTDNETTQAAGNEVMLAILIVSCVLFVFYIITTAMSFHGSRRVNNHQFNSW